MNEFLDPFSNWKCIYLKEVLYYEPWKFHYVQFIYKIFKMNTEMFHTKDFKNNCDRVQVNCTAWRGIMLYSIFQIFPYYYNVLIL